MTDNPQEIAGLVADTESGRSAPTPAQVQMNEEIQPYAKEAADATGIAGNVAAYGKLAAKRVGQFATNPKEFAGMMAENLPNSVPGIAGGLVGAKVGGLAGSVAGPVGSTVGAITGGFLGGTAGG